MTNPTLALIVEDEADLAVIFSTALQKAGYTVDVATNGEEALAKLHANVPYLVLLDLHLPKISGQEILDQIYDDPKFKDSRLIVASADARRAADLEEKASYVLIKPIDFYQLMRLGERLRPESVSSS